MASPESTAQDEPDESAQPSIDPPIGADGLRRWPDFVGSFWRAEVVSVVFVELLAVGVVFDFWELCLLGTFEVGWLSLSRPMFTRKAMHAVVLPVSYSAASFFSLTPAIFRLLCKLSSTMWCI
jgi:hypothetical protein